jgi:hypothetical protein
MFLSYTPDPDFVASMAYIARTLAEIGSCVTNAPSTTAAE